MEFKIVIPTANRFDRIVSNNYFKNSIICCPESEYDRYKYACPKTEIVTHPDSVKGLGAKRNWILNEFGSVFMIDDDVKGLTRLYSTKRRQQCSAEEAYWIIQNAANVAKLAGAYLYGFNHFRNPAHYHGHEVFKMTGYVNGCGLGIHEGGGLSFRSDLIAVNDFYVSALNAYKNRFCMIDNRFVFNQNKIANEKGGLGNFRNNETEKSDINILQDLFGDAIVSKKNTTTSKSSIKYGRTLKIPY